MIGCGLGMFVHRFLKRLKSCAWGILFYEIFYEVEFLNGKQEGILWFLEF